MSKEILEILKKKFNDINVINDYQNIVDDGMYPFEIYFVKRYIEDLKNKVILNPGCGAGREAVWLASAGAYLHCVDISEEMINKTKKNFFKLGLTGNYEVSDCFRNWKDQSFDIIFSTNNFLEHIPGRSNRQKILRNFSAALKNKGIFITCVHDRQISYKEWEESWKKNKLDVENNVFINGYAIEIGDKFIKQVTVNDDGRQEMFNFFSNIL